MTVPAPVIFKYFSQKISAFPLTTSKTTELCSGTYELDFTSAIRRLRIHGHPFERICESDGRNGKFGRFKRDLLINFRIVKGGRAQDDLVAAVHIQEIAVFDLCIALHYAEHSAVIFGQVGRSDDIRG